MTLQLERENLDGLAPEVAALYKQRAEGGYTLDVDGGTSDAARLQRALHNERALRKAAERALRDGGGGDALGVAQEERDAAAAERDAARERADALTREFFRERIAAAARAAGLMPSAIADAQRAAAELFTVADDGSITATESGTAATVAEWLASARRLAALVPSPERRRSAAVVTHGGRHDVDALAIRSADPGAKNGGRERRQLSDYKLREPSWTTILSFLPSFSRSRRRPVGIPRNAD